MNQPSVTSFIPSKKQGISKLKTTGFKERIASPTVLIRLPKLVTWFHKQRRLPHQHHISVLTIVINHRNQSSNRCLVFIHQYESIPIICNITRISNPYLVSIPSPNNATNFDGPSKTPNILSKHLFFKFIY